jgi:3-dehydroquinate dehydratase
MSKAIYVLNGTQPEPGSRKREPEIYGQDNARPRCEAMCRKAAGKRPIPFRQSRNAEHDRIDWIHEAIDTIGAPGDHHPTRGGAGFTFTSVAMHRTNADDVPPGRSSSCTPPTCIAARRSYHKSDR